jgi:hypothetical protein
MLRQGAYSVEMSPKNSRNANMFKVYNPKKKSMFLSPVREATISPTSKFLLDIQSTTDRDMTSFDRTYTNKIKLSGSVWNKKAFILSPLSSKEVLKLKKS